MSGYDGFTLIIYTGLFLFALLVIVIVCLIWIFILSLKKDKDVPKGVNIYRIPQKILIFSAILAVVSFGLCSAVLFLPVMLK